ncbi:hypothetical protein CgunFtcFv8_024261 [Champsocephalus gunnari]|uniref:Uncharacterized protein n=1 Tax=Champsocephalus gunnari TaxID=52237 RepID=A0AAN8HMA6_CHAGU|nr:hypothetical protein CgunFtcFv8_024261 [Champsocephalus gunnari]
MDGYMQVLQNWHGTTITGSYYTAGFPQLIQTETEPSDDIIRWHAFQNRVTPAFCSSDFNSSQGTPSITTSHPAMWCECLLCEQAKDLPAAPLFVSSMGTTRPRFKAP